jgi:pimeloyl-ACP methyl ester carboxylesterase
MKTLTLDGAHVAFDAAGAGPAVVFLHAFPLSSAMWLPQAAALAEEYQVVRVDARGFGGSDAGEGPLAMDRIAADTIAVLDHLGIDRAVVCGCSMGGYAAFALARQAAARLRGLVLVGTKAAPDNDEARAGRAALAEKVLASGAGAAAEALLPKLLGATTHRERGPVVERVRAWIQDSAPGAIANGALGLGERADSRPTLASIHVSTLVVRGEEDVVTSAEDARVMNEGIAGSRLVSIPAAGHLTSLEAGPRFDEVLARFLREL